MPRRKQRSQLDGLSLGFLETHPADAADELERQSTTDAVAVLAAVPVRIAAAVVAEMLPLHAAHCLLMCTEELRSALLHPQPVQIIAALLRHFNQEQRTQALTQLPSTTAMTCRLLLRHPENSVGAIVDGNAMAIVPTMTVKEALAKVRQEQQGNTDYIYVINSQRHIVGSVALADLLRSNQHHTLETILDKNVPHLSVQATLTAAYAHPGWGDYHMLPVVEREQRFVGALRYADLHHHMQKQGGMQPMRENPRLSLKVIGAGYWHIFALLLQGVVNVLPPTRGSETDKHP
jgi:magnesium transporter